MPAHSGSAAGKQGGNNWMAAALAGPYRAHKPPRTPRAVPRQARKLESPEPARRRTAAVAAAARVAAGERAGLQMPRPHRPQPHRSAARPAESQAAAQAVAWVLPASRRIITNEATQGCTRASRLIHPFDKL